MLKLIVLILAFYTGEYIDGLTKTCYYSSAKGTHAITIQAHQVCPMNIEV